MLSLEVYGLGSIDFPDPLGWINERVQAFIGLPEKWDAEWRELARIAALHPERRTEAARLMVELRELQALHRSVMDKLRIRDASLGVIAPVVYAITGGATAIAIAGTMYAIFRRSTAAELILEALRDGVITKEEADALLEDAKRSSPTLAGTASDAIRVAAWGVAVWAGFNVWREYSRKRRR